MSPGAQKITTGHVVDGKYRIGRQLGQGGMGAVYEATHLGTNRRVALKVIVSEALANEADVVLRFEREARASGSIDSVHVVQVLDTGVDPVTTYPYMVMEYLSGEDVSDLVRRVGPLPPDLVTRIGAQACLGLQRAHDAGVVHRDIKSANLFLSRRDGGEVQLKLLDFGIAKVRAEPVPSGQDHGLTRTGSMLGSPLYMSPEQARGVKTIDGRSDIWSLGIVLYEALVGETPFHEKQTLGDLLVAICVEQMPAIQERAPWIPPALATVIDRALRRDPAHRFDSASSMHAALAELVSGGIGIRESMLGPVSAEVRARVAARVDRTVAMTPGRGGSTPPLGITPGGSPMVRSDPGVLPGGGASRSRESDAQVAGSVTAGELARSRGGLGGGGGKLAALAAFGLLACAGLGLAVVARRPQPPAAPARAIVDPSVVASASSASPLLVPIVASAAPAKTATVTIAAPSGATVEVDGRPAPVRDGAAEIVGPPGSLHRVRVRAGDDVKEADVTILESGAAMPARIELANGAKKRATETASATSARAGGAKVPPASAAPAPPSKPTQSEPQILQNF